MKGSCVNGHQSPELFCLVGDGEVPNGRPHPRMEPLLHYFSHLKNAHFLPLLPPGRPDSLLALSVCLWDLISCQQPSEPCWLLCRRPLLPLLSGGLRGAQRALFLSEIGMRADRRGRKVWALLLPWTRMVMGNWEPSLCIRALERSCGLPARGCPGEPGRGWVWAGVLAGSRRWQEEPRHSDHSRPAGGPWVLAQMPGEQALVLSCPLETKGILHYVVQGARLWCELPEILRREEGEWPPGLPNGRVGGGGGPSVLTLAAGDSQESSASCGQCCCFLSLCLPSSRSLLKSLRPPWGWVTGWPS